MWPKKTKPEWIKRFARGLAEDQQHFGIRLAGGDTTATPGPLCLSMTALGLVPRGRMLRRSGAKPGDDVYVSGTLGNAAMGLSLLQAGGSAKQALVQRYLLPEPRLALGLALRGVATSAMDISDGLLQDMGHLCAASNVGAEIFQNMLPLSPPMRAYVKRDPALIEKVQSGGDDYELLFTAPPAKAKKITALAKKLNLPLAKIGRVVQGTKVMLFDERNRPIKPKRLGFSHFS